MAGRDEERSIGELFTQLANDSANLMRQELQLAKVEVGQKVSAAGKQLGLMAIGGGVAYAGLLAIVAGLIVLLGQYLAVWLSAFIVGVAVAGVGYYLIQGQLAEFKHLDPTPRATIETLKQDKEWVKEQIK